VNPIKTKRECLLIDATLQCWLCREAFDLNLFVFDGARLGHPRYWCARCTSTPRVFAKLLRERIASLQADAGETYGAEIGFVRQVLARQFGTDAVSIPSPICLPDRDVLDVAA
jgi:hypothetical protein